jgi:hypothetical protein
MENYLKGRGFKDEDANDQNFQGFLEGKAVNSPQIQSDSIEPKPKDTSKSTIYEEDGCPKVEVVSEDGRPTTLIVHLPDGRLLEIDCIY